ncbi:hypothetical protein HB904_04030 [Listeria booriae]|uniref:Uncharacterized protein n=1 Tax=Listeria booriae TaxID=1552123 RepID=A0A842AI20_9LIST|nr:hypothetical protein [Listeria booriae]MBC1615341.1 hypothetical protein [Listeria booriae]
MTIIKKGDVVQAKCIVFLAGPNGSTVAYSKGARFRVSKIIDSKMLKVKSLNSAAEGVVLVSDIKKKNV